MKSTALISLSRSKRLRVAGRTLRRRWTSVLVILLAGVLIVAAVVSPGLSVNDARLNAGSIYVVKGSAALIGSVNLQSQNLAAATASGSRDLEVLQSGDLVIARNRDPDQLAVYDPATNSLGASQTLPLGARVVMGGPTLAVLGSSAGRVWYGPTATMLKTDFQRAQSQFSLGVGGLITVTTSGAVIGLDVANSSLVRPSGGTSTTKVPLPDALPDNADVQLSAVGERAVVLDRTSFRIWVEGTDAWGSIDAAANAQLAAPVATMPALADRIEALYSSGVGLVAWTSKGARSLSGQLPGNPIQPVVAQGCAYAVSGSEFIKSCPGVAPLVRTIPELPSGNRLAFAVNRDQVVLNDLVSGYVWLVDQNMLLIKDWSAVTPQENKKESDQPDADTQTNPERTVNHPPVAKNDKLSARSGRSTYLRVLDNDTDIDGDVITITSVSRVSGSGASLQITGDGTGLQLTLTGSADQQASFSYTIADGRGGTSSANVSVAVLPDQASFNTKPEHYRSGNILVIGQIQQVTKRALLDWRDPDGDDLVLVGAELVDDTDDQLSWTPDGRITFQDVGKTTGTKKVSITVSDGLATTTSVMLIQVDKKRVVAPIANADYVTTEVDKTIVVAPLLNDVGANLIVSEVKGENTSKPVIVPNPLDNTFTVRVTEVGTYYLTYKVSNGQIATGLVRVDVLPPPQGNHPPVAARDLVLLPRSGKALVDPLINDSDADNDVLVVQSVDVPPGAGVNVTITQRHLLTIKQTSVSDQPVTLTYHVSDGLSIVQGTIVVIPTNPPGVQKPSAGRDVVKARAGSIVTIPVLDNDTSPVGLDLTVDSIQDDPNKRAWVEGDKIRVAVPAGTSSAAPLTFTYTVRDSDGQTDSAGVTVTVISTDAQNEAPKPLAVEGRVTAGTTTKIPIPMSALDPNGDPVHLVGLASGPRQGRLVSVGPNYLVYEAFPNSQGTDSFRYQVSDGQGATGDAEIRIGIAPATGANNPPTLVNDVVTVRPGREVTLPVLANDSDIDGDAFSLAPQNPVSLGSLKTTVNKDAGTVSFTAPSTATTVSGSYTVVDNRQGESIGAIVVTTDPTAPLLAPVASDDQVALSSIAGKDRVAVAVLDNDYDIDGAPGQLTVSVPAGQGTPSNAPRVGADGTVDVPVSAQTRQYRYVITDADKNTATGVITVPGTNDEVPALTKEASETIEVVAGQKYTIDLATAVRGTQDRKVRLTSTDLPVATVNQLVPLPEKLEWTPDIRYAGLAAVSFEVIDKTDDGDPTARRAWLTMRFKVVPPPNVPSTKASPGSVTNGAPTLIGPVPVLLVGVGETARVQLTNSYRDPEGDGFRFQDWKVDTTQSSASTDTLKWSQESQTVIVATASYGAKVGTRLVLNGVVIDAKEATNGKEVTREVGPGTVRVIIEVTSSTRPPPTVVADLVSDASAGRPTTVEVLRNDKSNLPDNPALYVTSAAVLGLPGAKAVVNQESTVVVTPPADFYGEMTVVYTVQDATRDANRSSQGTIRLTVRATPGPPGVPVEQDVGDGYVVLKWTDGALNGLPITSRVVTGTTAGGVTVKQECGANTCKIVGLTNGQYYTFTVTQSNELGSATSGSSAQIRPDVRPQKMSPPTLTFGDGSLRVTWGPGISKGTPIDSYRVTMVNSGQSRIVAANATTLVWSGLTNGASYRFTVAAHNEAGWSPDSEPSAPEHPTGPPPAPVDVQADDDGSSLVGGWLKISWTAPRVNGPDQISSYDIQVVSPSSVYVVKGLPATTTSFLWRNATNGTSYRFVVYAHNRGPAATRSEPSDAVTPYGAPRVPTNVGIEPVAGGLEVTSLPDVANGKPVTKFQMQVKDTATTSDWSTPFTIEVGTKIPNLINGHPYVVRFRAWAGNKASDWSGQTSYVVPRGEPFAPQISLGFVISDSAPESTGSGTRKVVLVDKATSVGGTTTNNGQPFGSYSYAWRTDTGQRGTWNPEPGPPKNHTIYVATRGAVVNLYVDVIQNGTPRRSNSIPVLPPVQLSGDGEKVNVRLNTWQANDGEVAQCTATGGATGSISVPVPNGTGSFNLDPYAEPGSRVEVTCVHRNVTVVSEYYP